MVEQIQYPILPDAIREVFGDHVVLDLRHEKDEW